MLILKRLAVILISITMLIAVQGVCFGVFAEEADNNPAVATEADQDKEATEDAGISDDSNTPEYIPSTTKKPDEPKDMVPSEEDPNGDDGADNVDKAPAPFEKEPAPVEKASDPAEETPENGTLDVSSVPGSYTVDFYFTSEDGTETEYHLKGGTSIMLSELFKKLGIDRDTADIKETVFTDNELVRFEKVGDDYKVISLKPFNTEESLTITFEDGNVIKMRVEDAQKDDRVPGTESGIWWGLDAEGNLTIRPQSSRTKSNPAYFITVHTGDTISEGQATWDSFWKHKVGNASIRTEVKNVIITTNDNGAGIALDPEKSHLSYMFSGFTNLETVEIKENAFVGTTKNFSYMFYNCSSLTKVTGLEYLDATNTQQMQRMFSNCTSLKSVDLSSWKNAEQVSNMQNMFNGCTALTTVTMPGKNFAVNENALLAGMFEDCESLTTVDFGTADNHMDVTKAKTMTNMFKGCSALETLDVSTFGTLTNIEKMDGFVNGCTSLKTLNIDNLDNSRIGPTNSRHHTSESTAYSTGAEEYGRMLDIHTCTALETLSAKKSNVWMCFNERGVPGKEYYLAANETEIYYFTDKEMEFVPDVDTDLSVTIDSNRDYIDLITDRDGTNVPSTNPTQNPLPDASTNINIANGDLNKIGTTTNRAGMLAPGVYTITKNARKEPAEPDMCDTYYRIAYIGEVPYKVEGITSDDPYLVKVDGTDNTYINTKNRTWPASGNVEIDRTSKPIKVTYEKAAIDMNGRRYDVVITITKITFKDVGNVPTEPATRVPHDSNKYVPASREYYRPILQANKSDGLQFQNYVWTGNPETPWPESRTNCLSKGSGTDIEFTISIDGAPDDTSFVFKGEDLDVPYSQDWHNSPVDACLDKLPVGDNTYSTNGEGFDLLDGNVLSTLQFSKHTGLALVNGNHVMSTGSDPDTTWSEFTVKADAQGANYKWTSGISCTSYALRNTKAQNAGTTKLQPKVLKELVNGTLKADQFDFKLEQVSTDPSGIPGPFKPEVDPLEKAVPQEKKNDADGNVVFDTMEFKSAEEDGYFPGTADDNTHNTYRYTYKVSEKIPDGAKDVKGYKVKDGIVYDTSEHTVTIVIKTPENETEMIRGIKAEVYVDKTPGAGVAPDKVYWHQGKACVDCSNGTPTDIPAEKWYDDAGNEIDDPNPFLLTNVKFKNREVKTTLDIPVQKILQGRPWKDSDKFAAGLVLASEDAPMPENTQTIGEGEKVSEVVIDSQDTPVEVGDRVIGYKTAFDTITYNVDDVGTHTYHVRELTPAESSVDAIPGVTYDEEKYDVEVKVELDDTDPNDLKLVATASYVNDDGETVTLSSFTNVYDAEETSYKMEAVKDYYDVTKDEEIKLNGDEFLFAVRPIGDNAAIAPMPDGTEGSDADRVFYKGNEDDGDIEFEQNPDGIKDGMVFNYKALLDAGVDDAALHSDEGVDFEYVIYEIVPGTPEGIAKGKTLTANESLVNNEDGTYSVIGDDQETVYDGVHHTRKITVKVIQGDATDTGEKHVFDHAEYDVYKDFNEVKFYERGDKAYKVEDNSEYVPDLETLDVEGHEDDHKACYYISEKGGKNTEVPMTDVEGYDPKRHHFKVNDQGEMVKGAPIFINYRFDQKYVDFKVKKVWDDADDQDKIRPKSVKVTVSSDEGDYDPTDLEVKGVLWTASEKLPVWEFDIKTATLKEITYKAEEKVPAGYTVSYDPDPGKIVLDPEEEEFVLTVTNKHTPGKGAAEGDETYGLKGKPQTGKPNYKVNPKNPVTPEKLRKPDVPGAKISGDGKTVTIPGEGKYVLNNDGTITFTPEKDFVGDPTPIDVECKDKQGNIVTATYTPHVVDPTEEATVKRTINFTYERKNGEKVVDSITQTGTIIRKATEVDPKTGKVTKWGPWSSYTFPAVKNPDKEAGPEWTTKDVAPAQTVNSPGQVPDVYVIYHKADQPETTTSPDPSTTTDPSTQTGKKSSDSDGDKSSSTGDPINPVIWIGMLVAAAVVVSTVLIRRRRRQN